MKTVFATIALFAVANAYTAPFMATRAVKKKKAAPAAPKVSTIISCYRRDGFKSRDSGWVEEGVNPSVTSLKWKSCGYP